jgi:large subunit GTPase 1
MISCRVHKNDTFLIEPTIHQNMQTLTLGQYDYEHLKIPRKPAWTKEMTAEEIDMREKDAFLQWRREIAVRRHSSSTN